MGNTIIKEYSNGLSTYFTTIITKPENPKNPIERYDILENYYNFKISELESNSNLNVIRELKLFLDIIHELNKEIVRFFIAVQEFNPKEFNSLELIAIHKVNIDDLFKELTDFELVIRNYILSKDYDTASIIEQFCVLNLKAARSFLNKSVFLDLERTPFQFDFEKVINDLTFAVKTPYFSEEQFEEQLIKEEKQKQLGDKWYALLYLIELKVAGTSPPTNPEGEFIKNKLIAIGAEKSGRSGKSFYKSFREIVSNDFKNSNQIFGVNWKKTIIELSHNNPDIIEYLVLNFP